MSTIVQAGAVRSVLAVAPRRLSVAAAVLGVTACSDLALEPPAYQQVTASFALVGSAFDDGFSTFDDARWSKSAHTLGRGPLDPANVVIEGDSVRLETPSNPYEGAEIRTWEQYGTGTFTARARCAVPAGAVCAFFMYQIGVGDRADEIDIELIGGTRTIWFTTWVRGRRTNHRSATLPFDPALGMHTYSIVRDAAALRFIVDGAEMARFKSRSKVPKATMPIFANAWWPTWLTPSAGSGAWVIDYIAAY
jgi:beta-glucanase (GH16 family)